jgi:hypothetical protein
MKVEVINPNSTVVVQVTKDIDQPKKEQQKVELKEGEDIHADSEEKKE